MRKLLQSINWWLVLVYTLLIGGTSALTVFLAVETSMHVALAITFLFTALGGLAYAFLLSDGGKGWRILMVLNWLAAMITLMVYVMIMDWLHPALAIALLLFLSAGVLLYVMNQRKSADGRLLKARVEWEKLGGGSEHAWQEEELSPAERDVPLPRRGR
jgi:hypothetical protein